jgi:hypothetical protein
MSQRFCLTTKELCQSLDYSESTLRRLRKDQILVPGIHFVIKGYGATRPRLLWDPLAVEATRQKRSRKALAPSPAGRHARTAALEAASASLKQ